MRFLHYCWQVMEPSWSGSEDAFATHLSGLAHEALICMRVTHDANGNTLSDAQGRSFTWDFENRLTQVVVPGTNGGTTTYKYDPFGRRIQKSGPLGTTNYLYDGKNLLEE